MARWKLNSSHYINITGPDDLKGEWEYEEQNRANGRKARKRYPVPLFLDVTDPLTINDKVNGLIIVADKYSPLTPRDYIFSGPPTPEMEPLDADAQAISDAEAKNWVHPIETLPGQGYNQSMLSGLEKQLGEFLATASTGKAAPVTAGPTREEFAEMQKQLADLMAQNAELAAKSEGRRSAR